MRIKISLFGNFTALVFSLLLPSPALSYEDDYSFINLSLKELLTIKVSTASLRNQYAFEAPSKIQVINKKVISERNYRYLSDVIKDLPAVRLSLYAASADSGSSEMIVRGIRGNNKIVLMWNGQRLNHPDSQSLHITPYLYPLSDIEQIEVIYGSASALYGSDTVSMTINMISSPKHDYSKPNWHMGIDYGRYSEIKGYIQYSGNVGIINTEFLLDSYQTDGVDFSNFEQFYSRYPNESGLNASYTHFAKELRDPYYHPSEESITARLKLDVEDFSIQTYYQRFKTQTQIGWSPLTYEANDESGHYIFEQLGFFLSHKFKFSEGVFLKSMIDHTRNKLDPDSHWNRPNAEPFRVYSAELAPRGIGTRTYKLNYGNRTKIEEQLSWDGLEKKLHSVVGISLTTVDLMPKSANLDFPGSYNNSFSTAIGDIQKFHNLSETNIGLFMQSQYEYSNTLTFTVGGRFDKHNRYGTTFNPRLVINYHNKDWFVKGIYGTSFLAPAAFFTFDTFLVPRDSQQVPNTNLKPEETTSIELNFGKYFDDVAVEMSLFVTKIENMIMQRQVKSIEQLSDDIGNYTFTTFHTINSGESNINGVTIEVKGLVNKNITPSASLTYITGNTQDETNNGKTYDLIHTPHYQAKFGIDSYWLDKSLNIFVKAQYTGLANYHPENYRFPASENNGVQFEMDSFWVFGFGGKYKINDTINFNFGVTNAIDKEYEQPIVGQETSSWTRIASTPGIPRQYYLGLEAVF